MRTASRWIAIVGLLYSGTGIAQCATERDNVDYRIGALIPDISAAPERRPLQVGAVIAEQTIPVKVRVFRTDSDIMPSLPFKASFPKGTLIGIKAFEGTLHHCVYRENAFEPPQDDEGRTYSTSCIEDGDGDGAYETLKMFAYKAKAGKGILATPIAPVRLLPAEPSLPLYKLTKRLRVVALDDRNVDFVVDTGMGDRPGDISFNTETMKPNPRTVDHSIVWRTEESSRMKIRLADRTVRIGGIMFRLLRDQDRWSVDRDIRFDPWLNGDGCDGTMVRVLTKY